MQWNRVWLVWVNIHPKEPHWLETKQNLTRSNQSNTSGWNFLIGFNYLRHCLDMITNHNVLLNIGSWVSSWTVCPLAVLVATVGQIYYFLDLLIFSPLKKNKKTHPAIVNCSVAWCSSKIWLARKRCAGQGRGGSVLQFGHKRIWAAKASTICLRRIGQL